MSYLSGRYERTGSAATRATVAGLLMVLLACPGGLFAADQSPAAESAGADTASVGEETGVQAESDEGSDVVRNQVLMHSGRHGLTPQLGVSVNHPYLNQYTLGLRYDYFLNNWSAVGLDTGYTFAAQNSLGEEISSLREDFETSAFGFHGLLSATLIPFQGKFLWRGPPSIRYDFFVRVSGGMVQLKGTADAISPEYTTAPRFGFGTHVYLGEQASLVLELHDTLVSLHPSTSRSGAVLAKTLHNIFAFNIGVAFHFPESSKVGR